MRGGMANEYCLRIVDSSVHSERQEMRAVKPQGFPSLPTLQNHAAGRLRRGGEEAGEPFQQRRVWEHIDNPCPACVGAKQGRRRATAATGAPKTRRAGAIPRNAVRIGYEKEKTPYPPQQREEKNKTKKNGVFAGRVMPRGSGRVKG